MPSQFQLGYKEKLFNTTDTKGNCQLSLTTQNNKSPSSLVTQQRNMKSFISKIFIGLNFLQIENNQVHLNHNIIPVYSIPEYTVS